MKKPLFKGIHIAGMDLHCLILVSGILKKIELGSGGVSIPSGRTRRVLIVAI